MAVLANYYRAPRVERKNHVRKALQSYFLSLSEASVATKRRNRQFIAEDFNTHLSIIDRTSRQQLNNVVEVLTIIIKHFYLIDIIENSTQKYTFYSSIHRSYTKIDLFI